MKTTSPDALKGALAACADALEIDLDMYNGFPYDVYGVAARQLTWFGASHLIHPKVTDSMVLPDRGLVILVVHMVGNLYSCLLADAEALKMTLMLVDGPKVGLLKTTGMFLPKHWVREKLYQSLFAGLKVTYEKCFYDKEWKLVERGRGWMEKYLENKVADRKQKASASATLGR